EALALWRGPSYIDVADAPWAAGERARLRELRLSALEDRIEADVARGEGAAIVAELERLTADQPLRERLWALRMQSLEAAGRPAGGRGAGAQAGAPHADGGNRF